MELQYTTNNGQFVVKFEAKTQKELWKDLASFQEVFEADHKCGICGCSNLKFVAREADGNDFFEIKCTDPSCSASLSMGQRKAGGSLFARRKDNDNKWLPHNGWHKYKPQVQQNQPVKNGKGK